MNRISSAALLLVFASAAFGQGDIAKLVEGQNRPVRVPIRSADPWFIKAMLEGVPVSQPEISTIQGVRAFGGGFGGGQFGGGQQGGFGSQGGGQGFGGGQQGGRGAGFGGGQLGGGSQGRGLLPAGWRIVVNPTDNSIWLMPEKA